MADNVDLRNVGQIADKCIICILLRADIAMVLHFGAFLQLLRARVGTEPAAIRQGRKMVHRADQVVIRLCGQRGAIVPFQTTEDGEDACILRLQPAGMRIVFGEPVLRDGPVVCKGQRAMATEAKGAQPMRYGALQHVLEGAAAVVIQTVGMKAL